MASSRTGSRTVPFVSVIASAALRSGPGRRISTPTSSIGSVLENAWITAGMERHRDARCTPDDLIAGLRFSMFPKTSVRSGSAPAPSSGYHHPHVKTSGGSPRQTPR